MLAFFAADQPAEPWALKISPPGLVSVMGWAVVLHLPSRVTFPLLASEVLAVVEEDPGPEFLAVFVAEAE